MPFIHMLEGAALLARQATSSAIAIATTSATGAATTPLTTGTAASGASAVPSTTPVSGPSGTAAAPSATTSASGGGGSGGSSPLLFFVALGFGVVFTNLWIIVGVKYCFRYNARARQMRMAAEDGEPINLENMPNPRRRRREKKLMTIDEVNEKFPMVKYKSWVASRAEEGLPTRGGVDAPSRANSVRSAAGVIAPISENQQRVSTDETAETKDRVMTATTDAGKSINETVVPVASGAASTSAAPDSNIQEQPTSDARASFVSADGDAPELSVYKKDALTRTSEEQYHHSDDDDDEHIDSALPPECVGTSGDTCAICIDTLEDDDDVRGLTCGHAFHAVCLDPWLTSRRACCPLCKADYYTPKPRAPLPDAADAANQQMLAGGAVPIGNNADINLPARPGSAWRRLRGPGSILPSRFVLGPRNASVQVGGASGYPRAQRYARQPSASPETNTWINNLLPHRRRGQSSQQANVQASQPAASPAPAPASEVTPSQLEAGVRN